MNEKFSSVEYDGVTYEVEDESKSGIYTVIGTQTATTNAWTGTINVPALYDGITIAYYLPYKSMPSITLNLTLADGTTTTGAIPVYFSGTERMGTEYAPGSTIVLTYWSSGSISVNGTATTEDRWTHADYYNNTVPTAYCNSAPSTAAKVATCTNYSLLSKSYVPVNIVYTNSAASAITLNVNATGAKPIYINGTASSTTNHTLPAGIYIAYYDGTNYQFRTDGVLPGKVVEATKVNGHTVNKDVPSDAVFTDTQANWTQTTTTALDYIKNKPTLGTAAAKDVPTSGNASTAQVVMGNDTRLSDARTPSSHTHGNIQNGGTLQTNDITIASGDKLVVTDSSDSSKVARTSVSFDGSTANKCLTQKGTWESFTNNTGTVTSVKVGSTSYSPSSGVVSLPAYPTTLPASDTTSTYSATGTAPVNGTAVAAALATIPSSIVPSAYCETAAGTAAKTATCTGYTLTTGNYIQVIIKNANSYNGAITLAINGTTAKPIYINGTASSSSNKTLPAGSYEVYYDGTAYQFRTDGVLSGSIEKSKEIYQEIVSPSSADDVFYPILFNSSSYSFPPSGPSASGYGGVGASPYLYYIYNKGIYIGENENNRAYFTNSFVDIDTYESYARFKISKYSDETASVVDKTIEMNYQDIILSDKWDGTNTSLKDTISSINTSKAAKSDAIKNITRSGTTFTATRANGTTFTFTQQDNNTTYSAGTALTLSGTTINHDAYGTSGTVGPSADSAGAEISHVYFTVNAQGHVTAKGTHKFTVNSIHHKTSNISRILLYDDGQVAVQTKGFLSCNNYANSAYMPMKASAFNVISSRKVKENIKPITNEEAYKILDVNPVSFDYIEAIGGAKNQFGVIAEEVNETIPFVVDIPENYDEESEDYMHVPSVDYSKFIPHMIKLIQLQEEKIESMNQEIEKLKSFVYQT